MIQLVIDRIGELPENLRRIRFGPLKVLSWPRELDGVAIVLLIQMRNRQS